MVGRLVSILAVIVLSAATAFGQSTYGTLVGTVKDSSGASIPRATVAVTEVETNARKSALTDNLGDYEIPNLPPGNYDVSVTAQGFKKFLQHGVPLDPRATVRVDATLELGATQTVVEVNAAPPVITTETGTVSDLETYQQISQLPVNYRGVSTSPLNIITTIPGVQVDSGGVTGGGISVSGNHPPQNEFSVDGFSVSSPRYNGPLVEMYPSTEAVAEVKVTSQLATAEYGQVGDVSFVGKGGTNEYHGSVFEYLQNDALDAIPAFANGKPKKRDNTFGGSIGGPVRLPGYHGKNRTFFFFDYEGNRQRAASAQTQNVPTGAMLKGDFSALCSTYSSSGLCTDPKGTQLANPFTGQPYPNNQIPSSQFNPVSQKVLSTFYPSPDFPNANPLNTTNNFRFNFPAPVTTNLFDVRIDQHISDKQSLFGRFSWKRSTASSPQGLLAGPSGTIMDPKSFVLSYNYAIRPNLLNEFRFGHNRQTTLTTYPKFPDGAKLISDLGLQQLGPFPKGSALPGFIFNGASGITDVPGEREEALREHKYQIADNFTWIHGLHTIKMGLDIRELRSADFENFIGPDNFGNYYFSGQFTGYDFADFLLGLPSFTEIVNAGPDFDGHARAYGFFGQDSFKVNSKLTLDFGVRYEYHPPFHDDTLQIANFNRVNGAVIVPNEASLKLATTPFLQSINACGLPAPVPTSYGTFPCTPVQTAKQAGIPESLRMADKNKILPRLSFAYRLSNNTVVRAGAGIYDQTVLGEIFYSLTGIHTSDYRAFINSFSNGVPVVQFPNTKGNVSSTGVVEAGDAVFGTANQIDYHDPYAEQWSLTVERDLGYQTGLRVTYTGMRSVGLATSPDLNQIRPQTTPYDARERPFPNWAVIKSRDNGGSAIYNGLETVVTHRFSQGLLFQSSYVWSKNLSDAEGDAPNGGFPGENGPRVSNRFNLHANYGNVSFTRRHRWLTTSVIDIPVGRGKRFGSSMNPILDGIIGGWRTTNILLFQTGPYLTPFYSGGNDPSGTNAPHRPGRQRPDRLPVDACSGLTPDQGRVFDGNCFFYGWPGQIGRFGDSGVGILTGPGTVNWNFGLSKIFSLRERAKLRFESTFTNLPNHVNLDIPSMRVQSGSFGLISGVQTAEQASARTIQFALRVDF